jgi:hypothetical protein
MTEQRFATFEEFWPYYVREHSKKATRVLHFVGTTAAAGCVVAAAVTGKLRYLALAPIAGYGPAWISHFFIEKNRPATFDYPLWSFFADFKMWSLMARGAMDAEVERVMAAPAAEEAPAAPPSRPATSTHGTNGVAMH